MLAYETSVPALYLGVTRAQFIAKVKVVAATLGIPADWLMVVMYKESRLKPNAKNPKSTATGLIQWLESTAEGLGTTTAKLAAMNGLQQLDYVLAYYKPYAKRCKSLTDTYLAVHYPVAMGKAATAVVYAKGSKAYAANAGLDMDKNGQVTVGDITRWLGNVPPSDDTDEGPTAPDQKKKP